MMFKSSDAAGVTMLDRRASKATLQEEHGNEDAVTIPHLARYNWVFTRSSTDTYIGDTTTTPQIGANNSKKKHHRCQR